MGLGWHTLEVWRRRLARRAYRPNGIAIDLCLHINPARRGQRRPAA